MKRILILGARGRLGGALARCWQGRYHVTALARPEIDVSDLSGLETLLRERDFDVLVNGTGQTNVDQCETAREEAHTVNVLAPEIMGRVAAEKQALFIHFSTDYVFDGVKTSPYVESDAARPLGHYGATKLEGEKRALVSSERHVVMRVSWVFGPEKPSFVDAMIQRALTSDHVEAVGDKTSSPTFTDDVADWLSPFIDGELPGGLYHGCNGGGCTWQEYAQHALNVAHDAGLDLRTRVVGSIPLASLTAFSAPRPLHTAMNTGKLAGVLGRSPRPWQEAVESYILQKYS